MNDIISIIMPVKNGLPYLIECVDSIIAQTYSKWQLIIVNDHSTDDTWAQLELYADKDNRISIFKNNGTGIIDALNTGYDQSSGSYVTRMDADDIMPPNKLYQLKTAIAYDEQCVSTGLVKYFSETIVNDGYKRYEDWLNLLCSNNNHYAEIYKECVIPSPCWMMKRTDFDNIGGFKTSRYPEDYDLCFRMYLNNIKVVPVLDTQHYWRDHSDRASRTDENYSDNRFLEVKLRYFEMIELSKKSSLKLLGAGKKGKSIAKHFSSKQIAFEWYTNNPKKIGVNIYNTILNDYESNSFLDNESNYIVAIANPEEQAEVKERLEEIDDQNVYFFC